MAGQLNSAGLKKRKTGLDNSLNILLAIKHLCPDPGLGHLRPERISKIEAMEGGRALRR